MESSLLAVKIYISYAIVSEEDWKIVFIEHSPIE